MKTYRKGANAERELLNALWNNGFAVVRAAGSASNKLVGPDLICLGNGKKIAFECKAWKSSHLTISALQMTDLMTWSKRADTEVIVAWKVPQKGWRFLKPEHFNNTGKNYIISRKTADKKNINLHVLLGKQATLEL